MYEMDIGKSFRFETLWSDLVHKGIPMSTEVRFKSTWFDQNGNTADTWVLATALGVLISSVASQ